MGKFESLTKYLPQLEGDEIGTWFVDRENDGTPENPIQMPYVNYSVMVHRFIDDVYAFVHANEDYGLTQYREIMEQNGLGGDGTPVHEADVSNLDGRCVMALIVGAVRAERFCDGALLGCFKSGSIRRWLKRLKEIDGGATDEEE